MLFEQILLTSIKRINKERSKSAIFHLLTGKKSIQTVQDAHAYRLTPFYGLLPKLEENTFYIFVEQLFQKGMISFLEGGKAYLTSKGKAYYQKLSPKDINSFNGLLYHQIDDVFMKRLLLFIQVMTNGAKNHFNYIPIVEERVYTEWVREVYHREKNHIPYILRQLYTELEKICEKVSILEANIFVDRFSGYAFYGKSIDQLAAKYDQYPINIQLILKKTIHILLTNIKEHPKLYPILTGIVPNVTKQSILTRSAKQTYNLFLQGMTSEEIAKKRGLRLNTVYDHLVEISLYDHSFPFDDFISRDILEEIYKVIESTNTFKLKRIKEKVNPSISYFQIRLALAKYTKEREG